MTCPMAKGSPDIKACLDELKAQGFDGNLSIEYEYNWDNNVPNARSALISSKLTASEAARVAQLADAFAFDLQSRLGFLQAG